MEFVPVLTGFETLSGLWIFQTIQVFLAKITWFVPAITKGLKARRLKTQVAVDHPAHKYPSTIIPFAHPEP